MPIAGQVVGDGLRLVRPIGRGSRSMVYFAVDRTGQPRAVKIFPAHLAEFAVRELQNASDLDHPRLARIVGRTEVDGHPALIGTLAAGAASSSTAAPGSTARAAGAACVRGLARRRAVISVVRAPGAPARS